MAARNLFLFLFLLLLLLQDRLDEFLWPFWMVEQKKTMVVTLLTFESVYDAGGGGTSIQLVFWFYFPHSRKILVRERGR